MQAKVHLHTGRVEDVEKFRHMLRNIAVYSSRSGDREIWVMPAGGGAARRLTRAPGLYATPSWSPDGRTIAFRSERTGNSEIWTVVSDRGEERQVTQAPAGDYGPAFSPDGQWLAFSSSRGGALQLWRMGANGGSAGAAESAVDGLAHLVA